MFQCEFARPTGFRLDAELACGEGITVLFGPSGSGKTTILNLIAGLIRPKSGRIQLHDRCLTDIRAGICLPPERRNVGLVYQDGCLFPHLTVKQNLEYGYRRQPQRRIDLHRLVETLEIGDLLARSPLTLSGGEKQRVALGRALLKSPDLLLLDEPLAALDEPLQARVIEYLKRIVHDFGVPALMVTHNVSHVHELAKSVIVIQQGRITATGEPDSVLPGCSSTVANDA